MDVAISIKAIASRENNIESCPQFLSYALQVAASCGVEVHHKALIVLIGSQVAESVSAGDLAKAVASLNPEGDPLGIASLSKLPVMVVEEAQGEIIVQALTSILEADDAPTHVSGFCKALSGIKVLGDVMPRFVQALGVVSDPEPQNQEALNEALKAVSNAPSFTEKLMATTPCNNMVNMAKTALKNRSLNTAVGAELRKLQEDVRTFLNTNSAENIGDPMMAVLFQGKALAR